MAVEHSPLQAEIDLIFENGPNPVHSKWECMVHTPHIRLLPLKLISLDIECDYLNNYSNQIILKLLLPRGAFTHDIMPYKQELMIEVTRNAVGENSDTSEDDETWTRHYRAIIVNEADNAVGTIGPNVQNRETSNISDLLEVEFQLMELALEQLRLLETGGIYRNVIPGDVVRYALTHASKQVDLPAEDAVKGVDIVPYDNQKPHPHIVIPHGTKLQDLATVVQNDWGGIYNTGVGCYLQDGLWYLWPEFNLQRYEKERRTLLLINLPPLRYRGVERTYRVNEFQVIALSTGEAEHVDLSHHRQLNQGNAVRFTHTDQMWEGINTFEKNFGESTKDNRFKIKRADNNSEYRAIERPNYDVAPVSATRLSNNAFAETSKLATRQGGFLTLVWEHSQPDLIFPGMPTRLQYLRNDEVDEVDGIVVKAHHFVHDNRPGPIQGRHVCNTALTLFIRRVEQEA